jgi:hypothetical protein
MENAQVISNAGPTVSHEFPEEKFTEAELEKIQGWADEGNWAAEGVSEAVTTTDAFGNALTPSDYVFDVPPTGMEPLDVKELRQVQVAMSEFGIPSALGNEMARQWNKHLSAAPVAEATLKLSARSALSEMNRRHGEKQASEIIRVAKSEIERFAKKTPWILDGLATTELGNSIWLAESLFNIHRARTKV